MSHTPGEHTEEMSAHGGETAPSVYTRAFARAYIRAARSLCVCENARGGIYAKELPCVLTVRDDGKVSALLSFSSGVAPRRHATCPPPSSLVSPLLRRGSRCVPFPTSPAKDVSPSSQRFLLARFLRHSSDCSSHSPCAPIWTPKRGGGWCWCTTPTRWSPTHRNPPSQPTCSRGSQRERTGEKE